MLLSDERRKVMEAFILKGYPPEDINKVLAEQGVVVSNEIKEKWQRALMKPANFKELPKNPKLFNRYMIGADPEYVFTTAVGEYVFAEGFGLDTLKAFGCDMSGRQVELRAYPSRFVLDTLASLVDSLRWMYASNKESRKYNWLAVPYIQGGGKRDGVGGHIHFGRKRPNRAKEVKTLDGVNKVLLKAGVLDAAGQAARYDGTAYGRDSDFRVASHGYEYRTLPTWLGSPWIAYLTMVVAKLSIMMPEPLKAVNPKTQITNLLHAFKSRDDDAAIATMALAKLGFPVAHKADFKSFWGVGAEDDKGTRAYFPSIIPPDTITKNELFNYLVNGTPMPVRLPNPTWEPFRLPEGVHKVTCSAHVGAIMDIASDLVSKDIKVNIANYCGRDSMKIVSSIPLNVKEINRKANDLSFSVMTVSSDRGSQITIYPPSNIYNGHLTNISLVAEIKKFLTNPELFPICRAKDLKDAKFKKYEPAKEAVKVPNFIGRVQFAERGAF